MLIVVQEANQEVTGRGPITMKNKKVIHNSNIRGQ